jgi:hypothetical protein
MESPKISKVMKTLKPMCTKWYQVYNKGTKSCETIGGDIFKGPLFKKPSVFNNQNNKKTVKSPPNATTKKPSNAPNNRTPNAKPPNAPNNRTSNAKPPNAPNNRTSNAKPSNAPNNRTSNAKPSNAPNNRTPNAKPSNALKIRTPNANTTKKPSNAPNNRTPPEPKNVKLPFGLPSVKVSKAARQLFMKKASKILRFRDFKSRNATTHTDLTKIPPYVFTQKISNIHLNYFDYFPSDELDDETIILSELTFKKNKTINRSKEVIQYITDNISSHFYRHILQSELNPEMIDTSWFIQMQGYIANLSNMQRYAIYSYTFKGDAYVNRMERGQDLDYDDVYMSPLFFEFVSYMASGRNNGDNVFNKNTKVPSLSQVFKLNSSTKSSYYQSLIDDKSGVKMIEFYRVFMSKIRSSYFKPQFIKTLVRRLADTISGVISRSPPTTKPMVLFRGVKDSFFTANDFSIKPNNEVFANKGFVSTTFSQRNALLKFTSVSDGCCFKVVTVLPGTRCLPLLGLTAFSEEQEILFDRNVKFIVRDKYETTIPRNPKTGLLNKGKPVSMKIAEITVG